MKLKYEENKKMKKADIEQKFKSFLEPLEADIKNWITDIDKLLCGSGCKIDAHHAVSLQKNHLKLKDCETNILFTYTSRKNDNRVCKIYIGEEGCRVFPYGHHFIYSNSILVKLPESMMDNISDGSCECSGCATKRPDLVTHSFRHTHKGKLYNRCKHAGYEFSLDKAQERELLKEWLEMELACSC
jgi:integrase